MNIRIKNINLIIILLISFGILFSSNDIKISKAATVSATGYPTQIKKTGADLFINSITKNIGLRNNTTSAELSNSLYGYNEFSTTDGGLSLSLIDDGAYINCTKKNGDCNLYIYGAHDGDSDTDDMKLDSITSSNSSIVNCSGKSCALTGIEGTATITISYKSEWGLVYYGPSTTSRDNAKGREAFRFSMPYIYYNIRVTRPNTAPTVINCTLTSTGYTTAKASWTYTDLENDPQSDYLVSGLIPNSNSLWQTANIQTLSSSKSTNITGLVAGGEYNQVKIQVYDGRDWSKPFTCNSIKTTEYPEPSVTFNTSKSGEPSTAKINGQTLVLKTGDRVDANWSINNDTEIGLESCLLSTTGGTNLQSSVLGKPGEQDFRNSLSGTGFSGNINNKLVPNILDDKTYTVNLNCTGKRGYPTRNVNQNITIIIESYPVVSCSIKDNKNIVKEGNTSIEIIGKVENVNNYSWEVKRDINDVSNTSSGNSLIPNPITLNYTGTAFGRYRPWIKVTKSGTDRFDEATCGTITNLGDSNIREINP